ncbi:MAG: GxxExxY protein [Candidatus Hydrogenedentes bacterium]|nr:GxxExxY protein [Candidatus Hydrogenedentota bacterium]
MNDIMQLCDRVRETAYAIHVYHAHGHLEKVYENALAHRLRKQGFEVKQQHPLTVFDEDGTVIGEYAADLVVNDSLIVELKACRAIANEHTAQILGYLRAGKIEHGVLINFGSYRFEMKKYIQGHDRTQGTQRAKEIITGFLFALFAFLGGY